MEKESDELIESAEANETLSVSGKRTSFVCPSLQLRVTQTDDGSVRRTAAGDGFGVQVATITTQADWKIYERHITIACRSCHE